jgi:hypothetical protein
MSEPKLDEEMSVDDAKEFALRACVMPDYYLQPLINKADAGYVTWSAVPPAGVNYQSHKFSILDAFMTALSFCGTNCIEDTVVLGPNALAIVRTLPQFVEKPEHHGGKMTFVGTLGSIKMFAYPEGQCDTFWAGCHCKCCQGRIIHHE